MRKASLFLTMTALVALAPFDCSHARNTVRWKGPGGWGPQGTYGRMYDPKGLETLTGEVLRVRRVSPLPGMSLGVVLVLATGRETIPVPLGPLWYLDHQEIHIGPSDKVEVTDGCSRTHPREASPSRSAGGQGGPGAETP
ncbi:MAG: DNA-binding protein [Deltaproteobacteria bacterium]|nr:DNA-binding protein [Deltaproteobacteria bacterium]